MAEGSEKEGPGDIFISDAVVEELAGLACNRCYGVVGMASQSFHDGVAQLLGWDSLRKGVKMKRRGSSVSFDLYVVLEAGINIMQVAHNLIEQVRYTVESSTGIKVEDVQVHVQGVRVP